MKLSEHQYKIEHLNDDRNLIPYDLYSLVESKLQAELNKGIKITTDKEVEAQLQKWRKMTLP